MKPLFKAVGKYKFVLILFAVYVIAFNFFPEVRQKITSISYMDFIFVIIIFPPVFILVSLAEEWINRDLMVKLMGNGTGVYGNVIAFLLGSFGMGAIYVAFPIAIVLAKKGVSFRNMYIFLGAWSTTRVQQLLYEVSSLGIKYTAIRLSINFFGILLMGVLIDKTTSSEEKNELINRIV